MTDDFMSHHRRRMFERDIECVRANRSEAGARLYSDEEHQAALRRLEHAIEQAGGEAAYVEGKVRAAAAHLEALRQQTEANDATLGGFGLPPTRGNILAEDDALRMIGMPDPADLPVSETNLDDRVNEWAHGPHQRGYALEHKAGRDAVVGEVIETKASQHCRGPRRKLKADLIQILWTHYLRQTPEYLPGKGSIEVFAAIVTNRRIQQYIRQDSMSRRAAPGPLTVDPAAVGPDTAETSDLELLRAAFNGLSQVDQTFVVAFLTHKTASAAARSLNVKRQTFIDRIQRILDRLSSHFLP